MKRFALPILLAALAPAAIAGSVPTVLILDGTVTGSALSNEALEAVAQGQTVELASDASWAAKTAAQFAAYRGIILGDPTCQGPGVTPSISTAEANAGVWGPQCDGNTILIGTDEVFHDGQGGHQLTVGSVDFIIADATKTGLMVSLSCYYHLTNPLTPVPVLSGLLNIGPGFTVTGVGCYNVAHIVANHPALTGITDASLSNWSCSVHEAFDTWPTTGLNPFLVLAIAQDIGSAYTAPDGTVGTPYIIARGAGLTVDSNITLAPAVTLGHPINSNQSLTATVLENGVPVVGTNVHFLCVAGPTTGAVFNITTDNAGQAKINYTSSFVGVDNWIATYISSVGLLETSNTAIVEWIEAECYLLLGRGGSGGSWTIGNSTFNTQLTSVRQGYVVTMTDYPSFRAPTLPAGAEWNFSAQVLMRNPVMFPSNPEQWSQRLRVTVDPGQIVSGAYFGTQNGIHIGLTTFTDAEGHTHFAFPFQVGLP